MFAAEQLASDSFQRANEAPLTPAVWTAEAGNAGLAILNNLCVGRFITGSGETYTGVAVSSDQYASVTVNQFGAHSEISIALRTTTMGGGYLAFIFGNFDVFLYGPFGFLASYKLSRPPQLGDTLSFSAVQNHLSVSYNDVIVISLVNNEATTGDVGIGIVFSSTQTDTSISTFFNGEDGAGACRNSDCRASTCLCTACGGVSNFAAATHCKYG